MMFNWQKPHIFESLDVSSCVLDSIDQCSWSRSPLSQNQKRELDAKCLRFQILCILYPKDIAFRMLLGTNYRQFIFNTLVS